MQYNFSDPESRILKGPDGFLQGYNAQIAVEPVLQLIVGQGVMSPSLRCVGISAKSVRGGETGAVGRQ